LNGLLSHFASFLHIGHVIVVFFIILDQSNLRPVSYTDRNGAGHVSVFLDRGNRVAVIYADAVGSLHIILIHIPMAIRAIPAHMAWELRGTRY
jgi:hypothetical protein